jgi:hypothetical protein
MRRDVFQAIADPNRRAIIGLLTRQQLTLNGIVEQFDINRPAVLFRMHVLMLCSCFFSRRLSARSTRTSRSVISGYS